MKSLFKLLLAASLLIAGCGEDDQATRNNDFVPLTGIVIQSQYPVAAVGTSNRFTAIGDFSGQFQRDITDETTWETGGEEILQFTATAGLANAVGAGTTQVIARRGDVTAQLPFRVSAAPLATLTVTPTAVTVPAGRTVQFQAEATFSDAAETFSQEVTGHAQWSTVPSTVATIDATGLAQTVGTATQTAEITARFGDLASPPAILTIGEAEVDAIQVTPDAPTILAGESLSFTATAVLSDGTTRSAVDPQWSSSNTAVATIAASGQATAVASGTSNITATAEGKSGKTTLTVATLQSIVVTSNFASVPVNGSLQMKATGRYSSGPEQDITSQVTWDSNNDNLATVDHTGLVTGREVGTVTISASKGTISGTKVLTITAQ